MVSPVICLPIASQFIGWRVQQFIDDSHFLIFRASGVPRMTVPVFVSVSVYTPSKIF
jgi:hypothetical protein